MFHNLETLSAFSESESRQVVERGVGINIPGIIFKQTEKVEEHSYITMAHIFHQLLCSKRHLSFLLFYFVFKRFSRRVIEQECVSRNLAKPPKNLSYNFIFLDGVAFLKDIYLKRPVYLYIFVKKEEKINKKST